MISTMTTEQQDTLSTILRAASNTLTHHRTGEKHAKISGLNFDVFTGKLFVVVQYGYETDNDPMDIYQDVIYPDGSRVEVMRELGSGIDEACDNCRRRLDLYHNEATGMALCADCDIMHTP